MIPIDIFIRRLLLKCLLDLCRLMTGKKIHFVLNIKSDVKNKIFFIKSLDRKLFDPLKITFVQNGNFKWNIGVAFTDTRAEPV